MPMIFTARVFGTIKHNTAAIVGMKMIQLSRLPSTSANSEAAVSRQPVPG
jgi:hypothetical protein